MEIKMKGGVILIGSLLWETRDKNPFGEDEKKLAEKRENWRNEYLDLNKSDIQPMPIRYGRCSSSRACTYTMVFSRSCLEDNLGTAAIVPFKENIDFDIYLNFERMALELSNVEGINKSDNKLRKSWGCIALYINPNSEYKDEILSYWNTLKRLDNDYQKMVSNYSFDNKNNKSLLNQEYTIGEEVVIDTDYDFLFFTYIKPENRNKMIKDYPSAENIALEIKQSGYDNYFQENLKNGITTFQDDEINYNLDIKKVE